MLQRVDKPSHSVSVLHAGAHECQICSAPVLVLPRLQRFSITLKRRQRVKIKIILTLCQQYQPHFMKRAHYGSIISCFLEGMSEYPHQVNRLIVVRSLHLHDRSCRS
ncbi:hypothetical protein FO502_13995 [Bacillus pumilus]